MLNIARTRILCGGMVGAKGFKSFPVALAQAPGANPPNRYEKTLNQVTLLGRVGNEPQMRGSQEHPVVLFSLATHSNYQYASGELLQKTDWHRICVFKPNLRETVYKYMSKGQRALVQGRISYGEVKDANGNAVTTVSIIADDVTFFAQAALAASAGKESAPPPPPQEAQDSSIP